MCCMWRLQWSCVWYNKDYIPYSGNLFWEVLANTCICKSYCFDLEMYLGLCTYISCCDYGIHNTRYMEYVWIQKCVLALIFSNAFDIANLHIQLKDSNKLLLYAVWCAVYENFSDPMTGEWIVEYENTLIKQPVMHVNYAYHKSGRRNY